MFCAPRHVTDFRLLFISLLKLNSFSQSSDQIRSASRTASHLCGFKTFQNQQDLVNLFGNFKDTKQDDYYKHYGLYHHTKWIEIQNEQAKARIIEHDMDGKFLADD